MILSILSIFYDLISLLLFLLFKLIGINVSDIQKESKDTAILLIHGSGADSTQWMYGLRRLSNEVEYPVYLVDYDTSMNQTIDDIYHSVIHKKVQLLARQYQQLYVCGYSMGGLLAIHAQIMNPEVITKIITLSSPILGSPLLSPSTSYIACLFRAERYKQMCPDSDYLHFICEHFVKNQRTSLLCVGSRVDWIVPVEYAIHPNSTCHFVVSGSGHYGLSWDKKVWNKVIEFINS